MNKLENNQIILAKSCRCQSISQFAKLHGSSAFTRLFSNFFFFLLKTAIKTPTLYHAISFFGLLLIDSINQLQRKIYVSRNIYFFIFCFGDQQTSPTCSQYSFLFLCLIFTPAGSGYSWLAKHRNQLGYMQDKCLCPYTISLSPVCFIYCCTLSVQTKPSLQMLSNCVLNENNK